jgi:hypothetical protein
MRAVPLTLKEANSLVAELHRHHKPAQGHRFSIGAQLDDGTLVGAIIVGRPVARAVDQYRVAEVTRLVTDGTKNACSFLYARAAQAAKAMGFDSIQTYTLASEPGASLRAAGWDCEGSPRPNGRGWNSRDGRRTDQPTETKIRWRKTLGGTNGQEENHRRGARHPGLCPRSEGRIPGGGLD